jgi:hypothetical protein
MFQSNRNVAQQYLERRGAERDRVSLKTQLTWPGGNVAPVDLVDISGSGFLVRTEATIAKKVRVRIVLPLVGNVPAEVIWNIGGHIGCRFIYGFDHNAYPRLLDAIRTAPRGWFGIRQDI